MREKNYAAGITLVALVVTIVVLLILAGVTLNLVIGDNGIISKAKDAKDDTKLAENNERDQLAGAVEEVDKLTSKTMADEWSGVTDSIDLGDATEYHITNCAELKKFANAVNAGNNFAGITIYLDNNLNLQGTEENQWTPIGTGEWTENGTIAFNGTFDGQNHEISGVYINGELDYAGLFGCILDGAIIQNLGVTKGYINATCASAGGLVGNANVTEGAYEITTPRPKISNCYNTCDVLATGNAGGIVGFSCANIDNCYNEGNIQLTGGDGAGGIVGNAAFCTVKNCYNTGEIESTGNFAGGIVGWNEEAYLRVENCYNLGEISGTYFTGGISGELGSGSTIVSCYNRGLINGSSAANNGEIVGTANGDETNPTTISNCYFSSEAGNNAIGENGGATVDDATVTGKTEEEMKTTGFVALLNNGGTAWKLVANKNNGFPILSWQ